MAYGAGRCFATGFCLGMPVGVGLRIASSASNALAMVRATTSDAASVPMSSLGSRGTPAPVPTGCTPAGAGVQFRLSPDRVGTCAIARPLLGNARSRVVAH